MKVYLLHILLIFFITLEVYSQDAPYDFETEFPITMLMTPSIDTSKLVVEENEFSMLTIGSDEYNLSCLSHTIKNFSYGIALRLEDGLPLYDNMIFLRDLSFFDISWNYELEKFNFSVSISNILNFKDSIIELESYMERPSLVAEEICFNQEATSMIQASIQYSIRDYWELIVMKKKIELSVNFEGIDRLLASKRKICRTPNSA